MTKGNQGVSVGWFPRVSCGKPSAAHLRGVCFVWRCYTLRKTRKKDLDSSAEVFDTDLRGPSPHAWVCGTERCQEGWWQCCGAASGTSVVHCQFMGTGLTWMH